MKTRLRKRLARATIAAFLIPLFPLPLFAAGPLLMNAEEPTTSSPCQQEPVESAPTSPSVILSEDPELVEGDESKNPSSDTIPDPGSESGMTIEEEPPRYDLVRINEVFPNPDEGPEWIELVSLDPNVEIPLDGLTLHDNVGKVFTFASGTLGLASPMAVARLSSMKLNNDGDSVILKTPDGHELEVFAYEGSEKGSSWARIPDGTGTWELTPTVTPGDENVFSEEEPVATEELPVEADVVEDAPTEEPDAEDEGSPSVLDETAEEEPPETVMSAAIMPEKAASKKSSSKASNTKTIHELTLDMTHDEEYGGLQVRLHGTVGSMPGLVSGHGFILLSPTGRGIRASVPTSVKLPEMSTGVAVTGKLTYASNDLPYLKMGKDDAWYPEENATPMSREVNMLAPSSEDAWSLVTIEGAVGDVKPNKIMMDVDGTEVTVLIKGMIGFRAQRVSKGDTVQVTGLLEMTTDGVRVLPRSADEIVILAHAEPVEKHPAKPSIPGWVPFGAAGLAVVGSEGVKQFRNRSKRKTLKKILETEENV